MSIDGFVLIYFCHAIIIGQGFNNALQSFQQSSNCHLLIGGGNNSADWSEEYSSLEMSIISAGTALAKFNCMTEQKA